MRRIFGFATLAALALLLVPAAPAAAASGLVITGTLVDNAGLLPRLTSAPVTVRVDRFTSDERAAEIAAAVRGQGRNGLDKELFKDRVGTIQVNNSIGYPIAFAREVTDESGRHLVLLVQRPISPWEIWHHTRSADYPYTVLEIDLAPDGRGSGDVLPAARVLVHENGSVELHNLSALPLRLLALRENRP